MAAQPEQKPSRFKKVIREGLVTGAAAGALLGVPIGAVSARIAQVHNPNFVKAQRKVERNIGQIEARFKPKVEKINDELAKVRQSHEHQLLSAQIEALQQMDKIRTRPKVVMTDRGNRPTDFVRDPDGKVRRLKTGYHGYPDIFIGNQEELDDADPVGAEIRHKVAEHEAKRKALLAPFEQKRDKLTAKLDESKKQAWVPLQGKGTADAWEGFGIGMGGSIAAGGLIGAISAWKNRNKPKPPRSPTFDEELDTAGTAIGTYLRRKSDERAERRASARRGKTHSAWFPTD